MALPRHRRCGKIAPLQCTVAGAINERRTRSSASSLVVYEITRSTAIDSASSKNRQRREFPDAAAETAVHDSVEVACAWTSELQPAAADVLDDHALTTAGLDDDRRRRGSASKQRREPQPATRPHHLVDMHAAGGDKEPVTATVASATYCRSQRYAGSGSGPGPRAAPDSSHLLFVYSRRGDRERACGRGTANKTSPKNSRPTARSCQLATIANASKQLRRSERFSNPPPTQHSSHAQPAEGPRVARVPAGRQAAAAVAAQPPVARQPEERDAEPVRRAAGPESGRRERDAAAGAGAGQDGRLRVLHHDAVGRAVALRRVSRLRATSKITDAQSVQSDPSQTPTTPTTPTEPTTASTLHTFYL